MISLVKPARGGLLCSLVLAMPSLALSQVERELVVVRQMGDRLSVTISKPSNIGTVLQALCNHSKLRCEVADAPETRLPVAPMLIRGTLDQVLNKLLEGTALNFAAFPLPNKMGPGRIVVQARSGGQQAPIPIQSAASTVERTVVLPAYETPVEPAPGSDEQNTSPAVGSITNPSAGVYSSVSPALTQGPLLGSSVAGGPSSTAPLPGIPVSDASGLPLSGAAASGSSTVGPPLPGAPNSGSGAVGLPLP